VLVLPQDGACVKKKGREVEENSKIIENLPENQIRMRVTNGGTVLKYITGAQQQDTSHYR
jgi:translation initiation factor IF-1